MAETSSNRPILAMPRTETVLPACARLCENAERPEWPRFRVGVALPDQERDRKDTDGPVRVVSKGDKILPAHEELLKSREGPRPADPRAKRAKPDRDKPQSGTTKPRRATDRRNDTLSSLLAPKADKQEPSRA